ncbi:MAG TPA: biotin/lipoyl-binding protein, partial [Thermoanaerobacterales bacterium]|nr:biotin/lipoyl-binding protein [Thermoanaerobacterales bacterium]
MWKKARGFKYILTVLIIIALICGCGSNIPIEEEIEKTVPVKVTFSQMEDLPEYQSFPGKILAMDEVTLTPKMGGIVEEVLVNEGDRVKAGQVIIKLEQKDIISQLNQAQAAYDAAMAQLSSLENGQMPQQIAQLESAVNQAEANFKNAKEN